MLARRQAVPRRTARPCGLAHRRGGRRALRRRRAPARQPGAPPPGCAHAAPPWMPARPPARAQAASRARHGAPPNPTLALPRKRPAAACASQPCPTQPPRVAARARQRGVRPRRADAAPPLGAGRACHAARSTWRCSSRSSVSSQCRAGSHSSGGCAVAVLRKAASSAARCMRCAVRISSRLASAAAISSRLRWISPALRPARVSAPTHGARTSGASAGALLQTGLAAQCVEKLSCEHAALAAARDRPAGCGHAAAVLARARRGARRCCMSTLRACTRASCPSSAARTSARFSASSRCCATRVPLNALSSFLAAAGRARQPAARP